MKDIMLPAYILFVAILLLGWIMVGLPWFARDIIYPWLYEDAVIETIKER